MAKGEIEGLVHVVGDGGIGKTSFINTITGGPECREWPQMHEKYELGTSINDNDISLSFFENGPSSAFLQIMDLGWESIDIVIICFAYDNPKSIDNIKTFWIPEVQATTTNASLVILGLKSDVCAKKEYSNYHFREIVSSLETDSVLISSFLDCSVLEDKGLDEVATTLAGITFARKAPPAASGPRSRLGNLSSLFRRRITDKG